MNRSQTFPWLAILLILALTVALHAQARPDLVITSLGFDPDPSGRLVGKVFVTIANACRGSESGQSFVIVTFKESDRAGAKAIYFVGSRLKPLRGGESQTLQFDAAASGKAVSPSSHVVAEVDPYKKVNEVDEGNNWRTINPASGGAGASPAQCLERK